ncbi:hypothetical protein BJX63DRAFT_232541 [Aspergillus granulosus]|uniref:Uncharacterized protein n=1 Tax=Aspergillus granulosus TaxID=176169 RepID=A0ABR4HCF3_9EURO
MFREFSSPSRLLVPTFLGIYSWSDGRINSISTAEVLWVRHQPMLSSRGIVCSSSNNNNNNKNKMKVNNFLRPYMFVYVPLAVGKPS